MTDTRIAFLVFVLVLFHGNESLRVRFEVEKILEDAELTAVPVRRPGAKSHLCVLYDTAAEVSMRFD